MRVAILQKVRLRKKMTVAIRKYDNLPALTSVNINTPPFQNSNDK